MKNVKLIVSILFFVFMVSLVSAIWPFDGSITGKVLSDTPSVDGDKCTDFDEGTFVGEASGTYEIGSWRNTVKYDACTGKIKYIYFLEDGVIKRVRGRAEINEYYCDSDSGAREKEVYTSEELGEGICVVEYIEKGALNSEIPSKRVASAKWLAAESFCLETKEGSGNFRDETGREYRTGCSGGNYVEYSCDEDEVVEITTDCPNKCSNAEGCFGTCSDETDVENNADVAGSLTLDGELILDKCSVNGKSVKQYTCQDGGLKALTTTSCGTNRICVDSEEGSYCKDLYASVDLGGDVSDLTGTVSTSVAALNARVTALESSEGLFWTMIANARSSGQIRLGLSQNDGVPINAISGSEWCSDKCLLGYATVVLPDATSGDFDNTGLISCSDVLNLTAMEARSDWQDGSMAIVQYLCVTA